MSDPLRSVHAIGSRLGRLAAVVVATVCLVVPEIGSAACTVDAIELPVTMVGSSAVIVVGINGTDVPLTVDSGSFYSVLTDAVAQQLNLPLAHLPYGMFMYGLMGKIDAQKTTVKQMRVLKYEIPNVVFMVGGNEPGAGTVGVLGRNVLSLMDTEYDLAHGMIRLLVPSKDCGDASMAYWAGKSPVSELELYGQRNGSFSPISADVLVNGKKVRALFDTGATSVINLLAAHRAGIADADMTPVGEAYGAGKGKSKEWTAPVSRIEIGGESIVNNRLEVADFDIDDHEMLLGIDFFLSHRIYISRRQEKMFFTYNGGTVFARNQAADRESPAGSGVAGSADAADPSDAAGFARRGAAYAARGDRRRALADLNRAVELAPDDAGNFAARARIHEAMKEWPEALQDLNTALRLDPGQTDARIRRAAMWATGDRERAIEDLQALDDTLPPQSNMRWDMADIYDRLDLQDRALSEWNQWLDAHPNDIHRDAALNMRCWARVLLNLELDKALDDCNRALDQQPKNAAFLDSRAWVRLRMGNTGAALSDFDRAIELRPSSAWSLYGRGIVQTKLGKQAVGAADLEAARKLRPTIDEEARRHGLSQAPA
jgi:tetratricopeptide (TPR) repeat protein/predicted aspartyl protease